jgi:hypothetical protein
MKLRAVNGILFAYKILGAIYVTFGLVFPLFPKIRIGTGF